MMQFHSLILFGDESQQKYGNGWKDISVEKYCTYYLAAGTSFWESLIPPPCLRWEIALYGFCKGENIEVSRKIKVLSKPLQAVSNCRIHLVSYFEDILNW